MLSFATVVCFDLAKDIGGVPNKFESSYEKLKEVINDDDEDDTDKLLGKMMDDVFGVEGKLDYVTWRDNICKFAPYFFESEDLRRAVFAADRKSVV